MHSPKISPPATPRRTNSSSGSAGSLLTSNTNSLVVTGLPKSFFEPQQKTVLDALREHFTTYGPLYTWAPIKSFARVFVVYYSEADAERAKIGSDGVSVDPSNGIPDTVLRVFRADPVKIHMPATCCEGKKISPHHLRPPILKKNFQVSPPASPKPHWKQRSEEPPADDLIVALRELKLTQNRAAVKSKLGNSSGSTNAKPGSGSRSRPVMGARKSSVLVKPEEGSGIGVYLQPCEGRDTDNEFSDVSAPNSPIRHHHRMPIPTARPPMRVV